MLWLSYCSGLCFLLPFSLQKNRQKSSVSVFWLSFYWRTYRRTSSLFQTHVLCSTATKMHILAVLTTNTLLLFSALYSARAAPAKHLLPGAGGPQALPIPASCTLTSLTPTGVAKAVPGSESYTFDNTDSDPSAGFAPSTQFRGANTTFAYYLEDDSRLPGWNESSHIQKCLEQCYGYGGPCAGIAWGHHVWGYTYGTVVHAMACLFVSEHVRTADLVPIRNGSWTRAVVVNVDC